jgi:hypothetical protein
MTDGDRRSPPRSAGSPPAFDRPPVNPPLAGCRGFAKRTATLGCLAAFALLLSGCVYLRLLQLKRQLADFDANFSVQLTSGLRLNCLKPVVLADDLRFIGFYPANTKQLGAAEQWTIRWVKEPAANVREAQKYEIGFDLFFTEQKFSALHVADKYLASSRRT